MDRCCWLKICCWHPLNYLINRLDRRQMISRFLYVLDVVVFVVLFIYLFKVGFSQCLIDVMSDTDVWSDSVGAGSCGWMSFVLSWLFNRMHPIEDSTSSAPRYRKSACPLFFPSFYLIRLNCIWNRSLIQLYYI